MDPVGRLVPSTSLLVPVPVPPLLPSWELWQPVLAHAEAVAAGPGRRAERSDCSQGPEHRAARRSLQAAAGMALSQGDFMLLNISK